jgi:hypothetical protein
MIDVLSAHVWIWNIETVGHFKKGEVEEGEQRRDEPNWGSLYA